LCDFYLGSIVSKGDLKIAISTNGKSPTMAKRIREYLEDALPDSTDELLANLGEIRDKLTGGLKEKINALNKITSSFKNKDKVELNVNELPMNIDELNIRYKAMSPSDRIMSLFKEFDDVLYTSSFGTTAAYLLHLISSVKPEQEVFFLNTSYHFIETLKYKDSLVKQFNLNLTEVLPEQWKNEFTQKDKTWTKDQDLCCSINKVEPLDKLKEGKKIWISGLLGYQNKHRKDLPIFEKKGDLIKFYPIIDATEEEVETYYAVHRIPKHPLQKQGYESIGCAQCTVKGKGREGRWTNTSKTECGLHM
jgi:phosphoadenosine phosphosulfate reductase